MSRILDESNRTEYPFPIMDASRQSSSSSGSRPSRSASSQTKSLPSSASSSSPPPPLPRVRHERERDHERDRSRDQESFLSGHKLLSRLISRDQHDSRNMRSLLIVTTERLESETRRADEAERRVLEVLRKLRASHEATMLAQADAARANEEVRLHKYRLDEAQREINRAQEIVNELEQQKADAEAEAARARSTARRYREQQLMERAREEGRQEGYMEGLAQGKNIGYEEAEYGQSMDDSRYGGRPIVVEDVVEEEPPEPPHRSQSRTPARSATPHRNRTPGPSSAPLQRATSPPETSWPSSSRRNESRTSQRSGAYVPDVALHAQTLPVPTITTPLNALSPSHERVESPSPPPPHNGDVQRPIPIQQPVPTPPHPPIDVPPDGWIPYANSTEEILLPPPHELAQPAPPRPRSPDSIAPSQAPEPAVRSRDYAYSNGSANLAGRGANPASVLMSPQSRTSTRISQYDLVSEPRRSRGAAGKARLDRRPTSPRGPRPMEELPAPVVGPFSAAAGSGAGGRREPERRTTLERIFRKRSKNRGSGGSGGIPDIVVESPSTPSDGQSSHGTALTQPDLLSPEHNPRPLSSSSGPEDIIVMRTEIPGYVPQAAYGSRAPTPGISAVLSQGELPPGFVPIYAASPTHPPVALAGADFGGSPKGVKGAAYDTAPIPPGVVYPEPPGKAAKHASRPASPPSRPTSPGSPRRGRLGSLAGRLSPLPLQIFAPLRSDPSE